MLSKNFYIKKWVLSGLLLYNIGCFAQGTDRFNAFEKKHGLDKIKVYRIIKRPNEADMVTSEDVIYSKNNLVSVDPIPPDEALKRFGVKGAHVINFKQGTRFVRLSTLLTKAHIKKQDLKLMVYVNNVKYHSEAKDILTVVKTVKSATISVDSITKERYIDIRTGAPMSPRKYKVLF